jgi:hypothetical protein
VEISWKKFSLFFKHASYGVAPKISMFPALVCMASASHLEQCPVAKILGWRNAFANPLRDYLEYFSAKFSTSSGGQC